jgi:hypothetical protein
MPVREVPCGKTHGERATCFQGWGLLRCSRPVEPRPRPVWVPRMHDALWDRPSQPPVPDFLSPTSLLSYLSPYPSCFSVGGPVPAQTQRRSVTPCSGGASSVRFQAVASLPASGCMPQREGANDIHGVYLLREITDKILPALTRSCQAKNRDGVFFYVKDDRCSPQ